MIKRIYDYLLFKWHVASLSVRKKNEDALRWGIIGTGYMSHVFSKAIIRSRSNILYAVASRSINTASVFAAKHGIPCFYDSIANMLDNPDIDIVYVATPVECHFEQVRQCLLAGKNVLCEKPLALNPDEAESLYCLAKERNKFLMEGMWTRCLPTMKKSMEIIESGIIGRVKYVRADLNKRMAFEHVKKHFGVLYDYGIYGVSFIQYFLGENICLDAIKTRSFQGVVTDLSALFSSKIAAGALNVMSSLSAPSKAVIIGDEGSIEFDTPFNRTNRITVYDASGKLIREYSFRYSCEGFEYELNEVYLSIKSGRKYSDVIPASETIKCLKILKEIQDEK